MTINNWRFDWTEEGFKFVNASMKNLKLIAHFEIELIEKMEVNVVFFQMEYKKTKVNGLLKRISGNI